MMKVTLITLGRLKESYLREAAAEYEKRLSRYCALETVELTPVRLSDRPSGEEIASALEKEAAMIEKRIPSGAFVTALCVEGKPRTSEAFSELVQQNENAGRPLCFVIGSSYGLSDRIKRAADLRLSVSEMTFPHQLFRVMLLEQIYRAFKIAEGGTYHK